MQHQPVGPGKFQSALPVWGATVVMLDFYTVPLISIHAPRVGSDHGIAAAPESRRGFQSTLPVWGATDLLDCLGAGHVISIHAPRVGSDCIHGILRLFCIISIHAPRVGSDENCSGSERSRCDFNPRSPCGERQRFRRLRVCGVRFQSTLPVWGATEEQPYPVAARHISIHAPRVGSDVRYDHSYSQGIISIHAPRVGSD